MKTIHVNIGDVIDVPGRGVYLATKCPWADGVFFVMLTGPDGRDCAGKTMLEYRPSSTTKDMVYLYPAKLVIDDFFFYGFAGVTKVGTVKTEEV